jgi:hypothetical protein
MWSKLEELDIFNSEKKIDIVKADTCTGTTENLEDKWTPSQDKEHDCDVSQIWL